MKKSISLIIFIFISLNIYSQNYEQKLDSLEFEIKKLEKKQTNIVNQIDLHQQRYRLGTAVSLIGTGISIASVLFVDPLNRMHNVVLLGGSILGISGFIISLNSFKFLNKEFDYNEYSKTRYDITTTSRYDKNK